MHRSFPRTFAATVMPVMGVPTSPTMAMSPPAAPSAFLQHGAYSSATGVAGAALPSAPIRMPASAPRVISAKRNVATAAGDWPCPHCGGINFARRSECFKCRRAKGSAVGSASSHPTKSADVSKTSNGEHGTWMCSCQTSNLITRDTCFMCQTPREAFEARSATPVATPAAEPDMIRITEVDTGAASQSSMSRGLGRSSTKKAGDWTCASCKGHNFASRELCFTCSAPKSEAEHIYTESSAPNVMSATSANQSARSNPSATGSGRKFAQMAGDWNCSGCGMHNFRNRETCRGCNNPKDDQAKVLTADDAMLPGDWKCPSCNEVNFRKREVCRACAVPKPTAAPAAAVAEASN